MKPYEIEGCGDNTEGHHLSGRAGCYQAPHSSDSELVSVKQWVKGQKSRNVFHIASHKTFKAKNKAKPVTTNLKKINIMNHEKVNRMNRAFVNIQKELANFSKSLSLKSVQKELKHHENEPANVDEATRLMAQL